MHLMFFLTERRKWKSLEYPSIISEQVCPVGSRSRTGVWGLHQRCEEQHAGTPDLQKSHHQWVWTDGQTIAECVGIYILYLYTCWDPVNATSLEHLEKVSSIYRGHGCQSMSHLIWPLFTFTAQVYKIRSGRRLIRWLDKIIKTHPLLELSGKILGLCVFFSLS